MRHRNKGRKLGRNPSHQRALLRSLASNLMLTERDMDHPLFDRAIDPLAPNPPRVQGRIVTTVSKAKEVRPLVEKCITLAKKALIADDAAREFGTDAERGSSEWKQWRESDRWQKWNQAIAPSVTARRKCVQLLGDREAVNILFEDIAPRFVDRPGGYTRVLKLAKPRLGDAGPRAILEFVGKHDRVVEKAEKPAFDDTEDELEDESTPEEESAESTSEETAEAETVEADASEGAEEEKKDA